MPKEVIRDVRSLHLFAAWKGQEFRHFLNYYGVVILRKFLPTRYYEHFITLFCAVRICSSVAYLSKLHVAKILFDSFITTYKIIYGAQFITSNVHNLNHVVADVERFGPLDTISAYPFENALGIMKRMIRSGSEPLKQVANRLSGRLKIGIALSVVNSNNSIIIRKIKNNRCDIKVYDFVLSNATFKDQWFYANNRIYCMQDALHIDDSYFVKAKALNDINNFFTKPFDSSHLSIFLCNITSLESTTVNNPISNISCKLVAICNGQTEKYMFIPLLHTLK